MCSILKVPNPKQWHYSTVRKYIVHALHECDIWMQQEINEFHKSYEWIDHDGFKINWTEMKWSKFKLIIELSDFT